LHFWALLFNDNIVFQSLLIANESRLKNIVYVVIITLVICYNPASSIFVKPLSSDWNYYFMSDYFLLFFGTVLVNNFVLVKFLGLCPFMGVSNKIETAVGMSFATTFVLTLTAALSYIVNNFILMPLDLIYLQTLSFILVIAVVVQFTEMVMHKTSPTLYRLLGIFLPLITTNCAILGLALLNINENHDFVESIIYGFGAGVGFSLVLVLFSSMRERLAASDVPLPFKGSAIAMITAGLMSLAFMGFTGLIK
tara:strand:- start:2563 stop:3318 length:756 start_codon:yes stop_codon:yes gene_type:complete